MELTKLQKAGIVVSNIGIGFATTTVSGHLMKVPSQLSIMVGLISGLAYFSSLSIMELFLDDDDEQEEYEIASEVEANDDSKTGHIIKEGLIILQTIVTSVALLYFSTSAENHWKGFGVLSLVGLGRVICVLVSSHEEGEMRLCMYV